MARRRPHPAAAARRTARRAAITSGGTSTTPTSSPCPTRWEYPWYAAWDLAFHCIPFALIDPEFAKQQLVLLTREWYMHPNGQLPAYEWAFGDVNPPVHAWAAWRVFQIDRKRRGDQGDLAFLERVFHKLMLNFTWWVNRKDAQGRNIFQGGFLGLDNIGVFDRSAPLPTGGLHQPGRRHRLDGDVQPQPDADRAGAGSAQPGLRGHRHQVLRALPAHRRGDDQHRRRRGGAVGRAGRVLLRRPEHAGRSAHPAPGPLDGGADPAVRGGDDRPACWRSCPSSRPGSSGSSTTAPTWRSWSRAGSEPGMGDGGCCRCSAATG